MTTSRRTPHPARARASGQRGFTLVELLVAMAAGLVVSLAAFLLSKNATRFFQNEARASASHLAATIGMNRLTADLQRAAYLSSPNILQDPEVCQVPASPDGLKRLAGISILGQGSELLHGTELSQSDANGLHPDSIIIGGSLNSTELFEFRKISDESGDWIVELNPSSTAVQRTLERARGGGQSLTQIFAPHRFLRIMVRGQEKFLYGVIDQVNVVGDPPITISILLKADPGLPALVGLADCGVTPGGSTGDGGWVNVVSRVRYDIRSLAGKGTAYDALVAPVTPSLTSDLTGDNGRTELVRVELDENDAELPDTLELIAEYAVDLKFGISIATAGTVPGVTNPQITRYPIMATDNALVYSTAAALDAGPPGTPQRVRAVQVRLSTRTRAPDRDVGLPVPVGPDGRRLRFLIPGIVASANTYGNTAPSGSPPVYARMRTLYADIALPNQAYVQW
ncbi:PilW family protein [Sorangium atrum]|uniref:Prepilin-type N-terminal cleavage/methylation domain-containing protein n=1 Tax=Sorangium atrum TaxID=2995308 RepID=A0ABT5CAV5_9BACT|nr:prepilin-type N-terminal cleavage/methylation domain-containing protein [Sorangium aterium]MDC0683566.1 prepilin-type N-terminal cleavage/methylation domain-containing protein [Sorangium aterium]